MPSSSSTPTPTGREVGQSNSDNAENRVELENEDYIDTLSHKEVNKLVQEEKDENNSNNDGENSDGSGSLLMNYQSKNKNIKTTKKRKYKNELNGGLLMAGGNSIHYTTQHELLKHYKLAALESMKHDGKLKKRKKQKQQRQEKILGEDEISSKGWKLSDFIPSETIQSLPDDNSLNDVLSLNMYDKFDYIPEDYGINFWEEGQKSINDGHIIEQMRDIEIYDLVGTANGCSSGDSNVDHSYGNRGMDMNIKYESNRNRYNAKKYMETRLWHMPYVPPKRTHLEFFLQCAGLKLHQSETLARKYASQYETLFEREIKLDEISGIKNGEKSNNSDGDDNMQRNEKDNKINFESDDSTSPVYQPFRDFKITEKIKEWKLKEENNKEYAESYKKICNDAVIKKWEQLRLYDSFDETALVAMGLLVEESMIATLLPLAKHHVSRCRFLEISKQKCQESIMRDAVMPLSTFNDPFVQWTLPLHEAIANLCHPVEAKEKKWDSDDIFLPSSSVASMNILNNLTIKNRIDKWSLVHGIGIEFIGENMDLFQYLIDGTLEKQTKEFVSDTQNVANDVKIALAHASLSNWNHNSNSDWSIPEIITPDTQNYDSDENSSASSS